MFYTSKRFGWLLTSAGWVRDFTDLEGQTLAVYITYYQVFLIKHETEDRFITAREFFANEEFYLKRSKELSYPLTSAKLYAIEDFVISEFAKIMFDEEQLREILTGYMQLIRIRLPIDSYTEISRSLYREITGRRIKFKEQIADLEKKGFDPDNPYLVRLKTQEKLLADIFAGQEEVLEKVYRKEVDAALKKGYYSREDSEEESLFGK